MAHTPGPWCATNKEYGTWKTDVRAGAEGAGRRVASTFALNAPSKKRGESILQYRERYDNQARQNEANARLIAAAPDLYDACAAAEDYLAASQFPGAQEIYQQLHAAIARAKGE